MSILKTAAASKAARFTAVAGLIGASVVGLATVADAATTPSLTLSSSSGSAAGGDIITVKGKGFMDDAFANQVLGWDFSAAACTTTATSAAQGTGSVNVTSATGATMKTPALAAGTWYLCFWDAASGTANILGQAKFVTGTAPAITTVNGITEGGAANDVSASSLGGTTLTIVGTDFTKKSLVYVDGTAATKTNFVSATKVTAVLPKHASGSDYVIKVTSEYGSDSTVGVLLDYTGVVSVSPTVGAASTITSIQLTGMGFNTYNAVGFVNAATVSKYLVVFVPGGTTLAAGGAFGTAICTNVLVESDTALSCKTPNNLSGAYSVQIVLADDSTATNIETAGVITAVSRVGTYSAANI